LIRISNIEMVGEYGIQYDYTKTYMVTKFPYFEYKISLTQ